MLNINAKQIAPVIHMNGSSKESLIGEWENFSQSLNNTLELFPTESFHGRNQYVKSEDDQEATRSALVETRQKIISILKLSDDILEILS